MSRARNVILVTGCPRSGTTPVGTNLALANGVRYLYEPFNPNFGLRVMSRFYEVPGANDFSFERLDGCVDAIRRVQLDLKPFDWPREKGVRRIVKRLIGGRARMAYLACRLDWSLKTVIWKDPTACLAAKDVAERHNIPVVVTVRPAVAVAASYKRMQWDSGVGAVLDSLAQVGIEFAELRADYGQHFANSAIGAAALWHVIYTTLLRWSETTPDMHFVALQDTIDRPLETYRSLYAILGLPWSDAVAEKLARRYAAKSSARATPSAALPQRAHVSGRSLNDVNTYGRKLLTPDETRMIEEISAATWALLEARRAGIRAPVPLGESPASVARC
ncbi:MAG: hypothetical protein IPK66_12415 [Rhodospirillales bacterium]|nr:hypothetical protein [Rhodospirillales bacterium]